MITQKLLAISLMGTSWILYLLVFFSVLSWGIMFERFIFLLRRQGNTELLHHKIEPFVESRHTQKTLRALKDEQSSAAAVAVRVLNHVSKDGNKNNLEEYIGIVLSEEKLRLETRLAFLGTIVTTAPFLGLLGTVLGIINAFHGLSMNKQGGDIVMAGVSEALVATALGLFIAIPAAMAYNYFVRMVKRIIVSSENFTRSLLISLF